MSPKGGVFFDEWQACLRSHYLHVLRTEDWVTEPTLRRVLLHSGLTEEDLAELQEEAAVSFKPGAALEPEAEVEAAYDQAPYDNARADDMLPDEASLDETGYAEDEASADVWDDDDLLRGDDEETLYDEPPVDEEPLDDAEADVYPQPDREPPPSQLSLF